MFHHVIAIGTSAGGVKALQSLIEPLPADFPAPIFLVMHLQPHVSSNLPTVINRYSKLFALYPNDGQIVKSGHVYIAPPNHHMIVSDNKIHLRHGPKIHFSRPSIDPLFYSIATEFGASAIGIILTGMLDDGTAGLFSIKQNKGLTIIQDLNEAEFPEMPRNALKNVEIDHCLSINKIASLILEIVDKN